jgi:magnesium transporter
MLLKIQQEFHLHELAIPTRNAHQRPKIETYGDSIFIVVNSPARGGQNVYGETHLSWGRTPWCRSAWFVVELRLVRERCEGGKMLANFGLYTRLTSWSTTPNRSSPVRARFRHRADIFKNKFSNLVIELSLRQIGAPPCRSRTSAAELVRLHEDLVPGAESSFGTSRPRVPAGRHGRQHARDATTAMG